MALPAADSICDMTSIIILFAVLATAFLSAVFGMAGGLILMGVLAAILPVPAAMVMHGAVQSVSNGWRAVLLRRYILWKSIGWYMAGSAAVALILLSFTLILPRPWLFIVLGLVPLIVWLPKSVFALDATKPGQGIACGVSVTGLNVIAGVSGPLLDTFYQNVEADRRSIVATKAATQVAAHGVKIAYYIAPALAAGEGGSFWLIAVAIPLSVIGTTLGAKVLDRMSEDVFRRWTKRLVTLIGAYYFVQGVWLLNGGAG
ncbi:TSUP family transporter [Glycocaulis abyssi]|uniref:Probable membrane transporter protein n=1 Tax=Glycocaulis abyssi TaxID=1433403 RepID=A0ABV9N8V9_9PROT